MRFILVSIILLAINFNCFSQDSLNLHISNLIVFDSPYEFHGGDIEQEEETNLLDYSISLSVEDTLAPSNIVIKLGSQQGLGDYSQLTIPFINVDNPNNDYIYVRDEYNLMIGLEKIIGSSSYFCEVYIEDLNGIKSNTLLFSK